MKILPHVRVQFYSKHYVSTVTKFISDSLNHDSCVILLVALPLKIFSTYNKYVGVNFLHV